MGLVPMPPPPLTQNREPELKGPQTEPVIGWRVALALSLIAFICVVFVVLANL